MKNWLYLHQCNRIRVYRTTIIVTKHYVFKLIGIFNNTYFCCNLKSMMSALASAHNTRFFQRKKHENVHLLLWCVWINCIVHAKSTTSNIVVIKLNIIIINKNKIKLHAYSNETNTRFPGLILKKAYLCLAHRSFKLLNLFSLV